MKTNINNNDNEKKTKKKKKNSFMAKQGNTKRLALVNTGHVTRYSRTSMARTSLGP